MIIKALEELYESLVDNRKLPAEGWTNTSVSFCIEIDDGGNIVDPVVRDLRESREDANGKETIVSREMILPSPVKRTGKNYKSNFLWDNSSYLLGITKNNKDDQKQNEELKKKFEACKEKHLRLCGNDDSGAAKAICAYFDKGIQIKAEDIPDSYRNDFFSKNICIRYKGKFIQDYPEIIELWNKAVSLKGDPDGLDIITGKRDKIASTHPSIKGAGGQAAGTAIVSVNMSSGESYGKSQGYNSPIGEETARAYVEALNYLLKDNMHHQKLNDGNLNIVYWAKGGEEAYQDLFMMLLDPSRNTVITDNDLDGLIRKICKGQALDFEGVKIHPDNEFYVLGLSPNNARQSIRFFYSSTLNEMVKAIEAHYKDIEVIRPKDEKRYLSPWDLLKQTVRKNSEGKLLQEIKPSLAEDLLSSILTNRAYPFALFVQTINRIRAGENINYKKASIIKGYLLRRNISEEIKEVLTVGLNTNSEYVPYILGRLFFVLEDIQQKANPGINTTIRDRYFNAASATPQVVFPKLIRLSQSHLKKLNDSQKRWYEKQIEDLMSKIKESYPARLTLEEQGTFQLGYYHQKQYTFTKKEER
ncbi:MAG: type I-C CRISPR-associated protein Cas8c/Csd1 [Erysipelotrichaceae bacterium]|nr:type I-C CRISPR-associated protein Cas8c/Csd1 [Erysipelotrichaceae bacterium]